MNARRCCVLILVATSLSLEATEGTDCCPDDNVYEKAERGCAQKDELSMDNVPPNINCSLGKYLLEPWKDPFDSFVVQEDGHLKIGEGDTYYIVPPHMFCTTKVQSENETDTLEDIAIACFPGVDIEESDGGSPMRIYFGILLIISVIFLFLTLTVYIVIPELRDLQGHCIMSTVMSQLFAYVSLSVLHLRGHLLSNNWCLIIAFFLYFWMLASFFWLNVASFNVWRTVEYQRFPISDNQLFCGYCVYGWSIPLLFLATALVTHHTLKDNGDVLRPNFAKSKCWFHGDKETWAYFYGPISILLALNVIFFVMTVYRLWRISGCESTVPGLRSSRFKCILYLKLFMLMGILWVFEVISFVAKSNEGFWYLTDTLNSLQGVFVFIIVVCRKRVLYALAKRDWGRSLITSLCPKGCMSGPDLEQDEAMLACPRDDETEVAMDPHTRIQN